MADIEEKGRVLFLRQLHVQGPGANAIGPGNLRTLAEVVMERLDSMHSKLKERFARLGPVRAVDRVRSGSPVDLVLRAREPAKVKAVSAALALARRGLSMLRAKRVVEAVLSGGEAVVHVPLVEDFATLAAELKAAGLRATKTATAPVDVRKIRMDLSLTQEEFAALFNLDLDTVQNWEQGRRRLDRTAESYLRVIAREHQAAARAQEESES